MVKIVHIVLGILQWTDQQPAADFYYATSLVFTFDGCCGVSRVDTCQVMRVEKC